MKIVISGFFGLDNIGDEAILATMVNILKSELNNPKITVLSFSPQKTSETYGVRSVYRGWRRENWKKIKAIKEADVVLSGGGGLLQDVYPTHIVSGPLPYYLLIILLSKLLGKKVMFFSQGIGPIETKYGKWLMKRFANLADVITVRDNYSAELLKKLGVTKPPTTVTSDIVFAFNSMQDDACFNSLPLTGSEKLVGVSVRPWFTDDSYCKNIAALLDKLIVNKNITPVFIPMENSHDYHVSQKVISFMKNTEQCYLLDTNFSPNQYLSFISRCDLVIGMRLHSIIFSTLAHVPHIGISYDKKVENHLELNGMLPFSTTVDEIDPEKLYKNAEHLLLNSTLYQKQLIERSSQLKGDAYKNVEILKSFLKLNKKEEFILKEDGDKR